MNGGLEAKDHEAGQRALDEARPLFAASSTRTSSPMTSSPWGGSQWHEQFVCVASLKNASGSALDGSAVAEIAYQSHGIEEGASIS